MRSVARRFRATLLPSCQRLNLATMESKNEGLDHVTCPFCGLACDDVSLQREPSSLRVTQNGCGISAAAFSELGKLSDDKSVPRIHGKPSSLPQAIAAAAKLLSDAKAPLIAGLGTDVAGARAALALADRIGAVVDHMNMPAKLRNILTLQNGGWITTTLAEIKNRADFVLILGSNALTRFPRFLERAVTPSDTLFHENSITRKIVFLGDVNALTEKLPSGTQTLQASHHAFARLIPALRALAKGECVENFAVSDLKILRELADDMRRARYGVIVWAAADFDFPHGELTIQTLAELIKDLNKTIRFAGFPLGGNDGDFSSNGTQTWQTGLPLRSRYGKNGLDFDPYRNGAEDLLKQNLADALLWISSFRSSHLPPDTAVPQIVLGAPSTGLAREPDVFIPVGTPGIHHGGHFIRADKVVVMPLKKLIESDLPSVATVTNSILHAMPTTSR